MICAQRCATSVSRSAWWGRPGSRRASRSLDVRNPSMLSKKGSTDGSSTDSWCSGVGGRFADDGRGGVVAVCHDHYTGVGAKVQVAELMTGRKRGDEQVRRI